MRGWWQTAMIGAGLAAGLAMMTAAPVTAQPVPGDRVVASPAESSVRELVDDLKSDYYRKRERAQQRLRGLGRPAVPVLIEILADSEDAEVVYRIQRVLSQIGEDFLVLCAHLNDRNSRIRAYAEEALVARILADVPGLSPADTPALPGPAWGEQVRFLPPVQEGRRELGTVRVPGIESGFTGTPAQLLAFADEIVPMIVLPSAYAAEGFFSRPLELPRTRTANVDVALSSMAPQAGLNVVEVELAGVRTVIVAGQPEMPTTEREVVLALCRGALHDMAEARMAAMFALGRFFGTRAGVLAMIAQSLQHPANPCADELVAGAMMAGQPMSMLFPDVPEHLVARVAAHFHDSRAISRQAAMRAMVTWRPAPLLRPEFVENAADPAQVEAFRQQRDLYARRQQRFIEIVLPTIDAAIAADEPAVRLLGAWAVGALKEIWSWPELGGGRAWAEKVAGLLKDSDLAVAMQALQTLTHLAPSPPPAIDVALELGFSAESDALRGAAKNYLRQAQSPALFANLLTRYDASVPRATRLFVAELLAEARDVETLRKILGIAQIESDEEIVAMLTRAFTPAFTDAESWPELARMLALDVPRLRRLASRIVVRSGIAERDRLVREILAKTEDAGRRVELEIVLYRLGEATLLNRLAEAMTNADEQLAKDAAVGLGESMTAEALQVFTDHFEAEKESTRLAVLHGIDAFGRACGEVGDVEKVNQAFRLLYNFNRETSSAVVNLARQIRTNFSGPNGYRRIANNMRSQNSRAQIENQAFPQLPPVGNR